MTVSIKSTKIFKIAFGAALVGSILGVAKADETHIRLTLAAGATTTPITVPGAQSPTSVTCTAAVAGDSGVGQATLLRLVPEAFIQWVGMDEASNMGGTAKISQGFSGTTGTHIIFCDFSGLVDLQVLNGNQVQVKNSDNQPAALVLNFVY